MSGQLSVRIGNGASGAPWALGPQGPIGPQGPGTQVWAYGPGSQGRVLGRAPRSWALVRVPGPGPKVLALVWAPRSWALVQAPRSWAQGRVPGPGPKVGSLIRAQGPGPYWALGPSRCGGPVEGTGGSRPIQMRLGRDPEQDAHSGTPRCFTRIHFEKQKDLKQA